MLCAVVALAVVFSSEITSMDRNSSNHPLKTFKMASISLDTSTYSLVYHHFCDSINQSISFLTYFCSFFSINTNSKEYGFGQSILYENQLVFHTPPYSLQPVSLQECNEYIGKTNISVSKYENEPKSPHTGDTLCNNNLSPIEKSDRQNATRNKESGSPNVFDRKIRKPSIT